MTENPDAPGWKFEITELSANVYRIDGRDDAGRTISRTGHNEATLMQDCVRDALELSGDVIKGVKNAQRP